MVKLISVTKGVGEFEGKDIEDIIVYTARVSSSRSINEKFEDSEGLLNYCIKNSHWSIFETGYMTFEIETSIPISMQLLRHRSFTFQQMSARYSDVSKMSNNMFQDIEIRKQAKSNRQSSAEVFDPILDTEDKASNVIKKHLENSEILYKALLRAGVARECARFVLPQAATTKLYMTGNIRSWLHFLKLRLDEHAQKEIREISEEIKEQLIPHITTIFKIYF